MVEVGLSLVVEIWTTLILFLCYAIEIIAIGMTEICTVNYINMGAWWQSSYQISNKR